MAYGASVKTVYETLKDLINKDQNGFITPAVFNNFAQVAQINLYNRLLDSMKDYKRQSRASFLSGRDKSKLKQIEEDLSTLAKSQTLTRIPAIAAFKKPDDYSRLISISTAGTVLMDVSTRKTVDICHDQEKLDRILNSAISAPKLDSPLAFISNNIEVYPTSVNKIKVRYYKVPEGRSPANGDRIPASPKYAYYTAGGIADAYDSTNSVDFELPEHYLSDLVYEIASLAGVNLRDNDIVSYSESETNNRKAEQTF